MLRDEIELFEAQARWICCPMCDRKTCNRRANDCDVKIWLEKHKDLNEEVDDE